MEPAPGRILELSERYAFACDLPPAVDGIEVRPVRARWDEAVRRGTPALAVGAGPIPRPILERLGFVEVLELRRLESVLSDA